MFKSLKVKKCRYLKDLIEMYGVQTWPWLMILKCQIKLVML